MKKLKYKMVQNILSINKIFDEDPSWKIMNKWIFKMILMIKNECRNRNFLFLFYFKKVKIVAKISAL
jgi:hypothetical protein